ncbi:AraC family transcriptional regulator [Aquibacillus albus]|uniref:Two-component system response regulator YesN n=1 Tax=Aquibacillus albus TaxID=1168171 RepID=A0ABS2N4C7_9BACI|nr:AraC family transcriptional regulator [Aquibacillus albus]MBM7572969.1 two-component system response regulator YesN [Aquibacillus albus]
MIKLLIAEDEQTIRDGIVSSIDWQKHNIDVCAEASNGEEALYLVESLNPNIVITDIQMPRMSGLNFIQRAKDKGFSFEAIVLTGYEDFNYAKDAIRLNVFDYILKPALPDKILETTLQAKQKIEQAQLMDQQVQLLEQYTDKRNYLDKVEKLNYWFHFPEQSRTDNKEECINDLKMRFNTNQDIQIGIVRCTNQSSSYYMDDYELFKFACLNITSETLSPFYKGNMEVLFNHELLVWVANTDTEYKPSELKPYLSQLMDNFKRYLKLPIYIGIGNPKQTINDLHQTYKEAKQALDEHYYHKEKHAFFFIELTDRDDKLILHDRQLLKLEDDLVKSIYNKQYDAALDMLESWLTYLKESTFYPKDQVNLKAIALIIEMQKFVRGKTHTKIKWENDFINWIEQMPTMRTFDDMSSILKKIFQNVFEILTSERPVHRTVQRAKSIIQDRYYDKNLTLESIANEVFVSSAYLSSLFKQELGIKFLDYLHQYRISQANILLSQDFKIYEVADEVGYKDERHFSTTFKKWTGITPSQFQKEAKIIK